MVRIGVNAVGRMKAGAERDLALRYFERFARTGRAVGLSFAGVTEIRESRLASDTERRAEEAQFTRRALEEGKTLILLDERGKNLGSEELARQIGSLRDTGISECIFAIGGADGHDPQLREAAHLAISLGRLTWPHQLCRIMLAEQLYRAATILAGHPYHRY